MRRGKTLNFLNYMTEIIPRGKFVLIRPDDVDKKTESGIIIPDNAEQETKDYGVVIAIGDPLLNETFDLDIGDRVIYSKYAGERLDEGGEILILIDESEIIAKLCITSD